MKGSHDGGDKIRFTFILKSEKEALFCYNYFIERQKFHKTGRKDNKKGREEEQKGEEQSSKDEFDNVKEQMMIYLQKEEAVFEKYGDEEAELYYLLEEKKKQQE